jgi:hypothetical protein
LKKVFSAHGVEGVTIKTETLDFSGLGYGSGATAKVSLPDSCWPSDALLADLEATRKAFCATGGGPAFDPAKEGKRSSFRIEMKGGARVEGRTPCEAPADEIRLRKWEKDWAQFRRGEAITPELLRAPYFGTHGATLAHHAAWHGMLDRVPVELLTPELFAITDTRLETPLHEAARGRKLSAIPGIAALPPELLAKENGHGYTAIEYAITFAGSRPLGEDVDALPLELLQRAAAAVKRMDPKAKALLAERIALRESKAGLYADNPAKGHFYHITQAPVFDGGTLDTFNTVTIPGRENLGRLKWSNSWIPAIGDAVFVKENQLGAGKVVGYFVEGGFLGCEVALDKRPEWHVEANGDRHPHPLVFGVTLEKREAGTSGKELADFEAVLTELQLAGHITEAVAKNRKALLRSGGSSMATAGLRHLYEVDEAKGCYRLTSPKREDSAAANDAPLPSGNTNAESKTI